MKYKNFPQEFWQKFQVALEQELKTQSRPVAVFDADGTLWDTDLGEAFFRWQIEHCASAFTKPLPADSWGHYRTWKESGDPRPAYLWLAQINEGLSLDQIHQWAETCVNSMEPLPLFPDQKKLVQWLISKGVEVYVVTASVKWAVEPGAKRLGLTADQVIGVATEIENGLVTSRQEGVITYREGKMQALLAKTKGRRPFLASGNTMGDIALLEGSTQISLAVGASPPDHELFFTEEKLRGEAKKNSWLIHQF